MLGHMQQYYSLNKFFLSQVGAWPYQCKIVRVLLFCFLIAAEFSFFVTQIILLIDTWGDINMTIEGIVNIILLTGAISKIINITVNSRKFRCLLLLMDEHWRCFAGQYELPILRHYADIGQKVTKYYAALIYAFLVIFLTIPLIPRILDVIIPLNKSRPIIYVIEAGYGVDKEKYYYPILLHAYLNIAVGVIIMINIDTTYVVCVLHGCGLFSAVGTRLENIVNETNAEHEDGKKLISQKHNHLLIEIHNSQKCTSDYHEMLACLRKHQLALEYVNALDSIFTYETLFILFLNITHLSLVGMQIIGRQEHLVEIIRYGCFVVGSFCHLMCICYPGQLLVDRSTEIFDRAYNSRWYVFSMKTRRLLLVLLHKSLVPCGLTAGKVYLISLAVYSSVMQAAMSYFTTFLSMR